MRYARKAIGCTERLIDSQRSGAVRTGCCRGADCPELSEAALIVRTAPDDKEPIMAILDCACADSVPGACERCGEMVLRGEPLECGFHYRCDRCGCDIRLSTEPESIAFMRKERDFEDAFSSFANKAETSSPATMMVREIRGNFCDRCMRDLIAWAPVMADVLFLKSEVNRLYRSISNARKNRNDRSAQGDAG